MKSNKKIIIVGIILAALILNAIFTWGIIFGRSGGFGLSTTKVFEDIVVDGYADVRLGDSQNNPIFAIPLVCWVYGVDPPPYAICFSIRDNTGLLKQVFMESISIEYIDGQKIKHQIDWEREFNNKFSGMQEKYVIDKLPVTVDRRESCIIRFVGHFVNKDGAEIPFDTTKSFEYEAHKWRIYTALGSF